MNELAIYTNICIPVSDYQTTQQEGLLCRPVVPLATKRNTTTKLIEKLFLGFPQTQLS